MFDIRQELFNEDENDLELQRNYINGLVSLFHESPEGEALLDAQGDGGWTGIVLEYAIQYVGAMPAEMSLGEFNEVVFDLIPAKVSTEADSAGPIIREMRAFWSFLQRNFGIDNAAAILRSLDDQAEALLHKRLNDPSNFGMAKSFFTLGNAAGFDMTTQQGLDQFMLVYNSQLLASQSPLGNLTDRPADLRLRMPLFGPDGFDDGWSMPPGRPTGEALKKKRNDRKRQRQAKKRNRKK
jgi:hypothetical protein